jgi:hypothetical protein
MASIKLAEHCTSNERGTEQITIEWNKTLWQRLLGLSSTKKVFVYINGDWVNKETRKRATQSEWFLLESLETEIRYDKTSEGHMKKGRSTRRYSKEKHG